MMRREENLRPAVLVATLAAAVLGFACGCGSCGRGGMKTAFGWAAARLSWRCWRCVSSPSWYFGC